MPDRMPTHWNAHGDVDDYGGKFLGMIRVPLLASGLYLLLRFIPLLDPGKANDAGFAGARRGLTTLGRRRSFGPSLHGAAGTVGPGRLTMPREEREDRSHVASGLPRLPAP